MNKKWKEEYLVLREQHETEKNKLEDQLEKTKAKLANAETHVLALESEVTRLATRLNEMYQRTEMSSPLAENLGDYEVFQQQVSSKIFLVALTNFIATGLYPEN